MAKSDVLCRKDTQIAVYIPLNLDFHSFWFEKGLQEPEINISNPFLCPPCFVALELWFSATRIAKNLLTALLAKAAHFFYKRRGWKITAPYSIPTVYKSLCFSEGKIYHIFDTIPILPSPNRSLVLFPRGLILMNSPSQIARCCLKGLFKFRRKFLLFPLPFLQSR